MDGQARTGWAGYGAVLNGPEWQACNGLDGSGMAAIGFAGKDRVGRVRSGPDLQVRNGLVTTGIDRQPRR